MRVKQYDKYRKGFPFYKVQYWDYRLRAWQEIQKRFETEAKARKHGMAIGSKYRIVEIARERRRIV